MKELVEWKVKIELQTISLAINPAGVEVRGSSGGELLLDGDPYKISYGLNPDACAA